MLQMKLLLFCAFLFINIIITKAQIPNTISAADKVYGLSKFWQEANYNFIYLNQIDKKVWDSAYKEAIMTVQKTTDDYQYYRELQKFCALLKDGHTNVYLPGKKEFQQMTTTFGEYNIFLENMAGKAIVVRTNVSKKDEIPFGSEVVEVNGMTTEQYIMEKVAPYLASSTDYVLKDLSIKYLLRGLDGEIYKVKIKKPKGELINLTLTHKKTEEKELFPTLEASNKIFELKWHPNDVAYIALNTFATKEINKLFLEKLPELYKAKALVIDLRANGGGTSRIGMDILQYFTNDTLLYSSRSRTRLHNPTYKAWGSLIKDTDTINGKADWGFSKKEAIEIYETFNGKKYFDFPYNADTIHLTAKRIVIPTVVLLGHGTASAAEDFLIYADNQKHFTKIGSPSFGSTGQPYMFSLPGGGNARVCTKQDTYPDGRAFVGVGIKPDIEVVPTLNDYLQKKDVVLAKALEYLQKKIK
jgi:C-terminal processing protease CtpA/Prc